MVDENNEIQGGDQAEGEISTGRKIAAFLLTLLLLPFLFAGACFGAIIVYGNGHASTFANGTFILGCFAIVALLVFAAVRTKNPGFRWGIVAIVAIVAIILIGILGR